MLAGLSQSQSSPAGTVSSIFLMNLTLTSVTLSPALMALKTLELPRPSYLSDCPEQTRPRPLNEPSPARLCKWILVRPKTHHYDD